MEVAVVGRQEIDGWWRNGKGGLWFEKERNETL
jgi:hypothetical protein